MRYILSSVMWLMICSIGSWAEEVAQPYPVLISKGLICDTQEQVERVLTSIALTNGHPDPVEGCGYINRPIPFMVVPLEWYETPAGRSLLASLVAPNGWTQYAWIAYEINPDYEVNPPLSDEPA